MLHELHLENLGIIEVLDVLFTDGLNVVTGETGAGKTLLVDAIELLVGGRADPSLVRAGAAEARIDGRFVRPGGDEVVVSRVIPVTGRSRAYLNGRPSTVAAVAEACADLVDLHGQHAHQSLLSAAVQRSALDRYCGVDLGPLTQARARVTEIEAALWSLGGDERERARRIDLLAHQVAELDAAAIIGPEEDAGLESAEELLADAVAHRMAADEALELLRGDDRARDTIARAHHELADRAPFTSIVERIGEVLVALDDLVADLRDLAETIEEDPAELDRVRARRQLLADLRRKYGSDLNEVLAYADTARADLAALQGYEEQARRLTEEREAALVEVERLGRIVGDRRRNGAPGLCAAVVDELADLALGHARLEFVIDDPVGDRAELYFSANPGSELLPLTRVASGGELARLMLALRRVLTERDGSLDHATLVFDEVDAGLGGAAAAAVGRSLSALAESHQVMVVTHLAQVAAPAENHVVVRKTSTQAGVRVDLGPVEGADRIDELARMLSGSVSEAARRHAAELLASTGPHHPRSGSPRR